MNIRIKYFGRIAELTGKYEENMVIESGLELTDLDRDLKTKYELIDQNYRLSVNQQLMDKMSFELKNNDEIALLPPFAGG